MTEEFMIPIKVDEDLPKAILQLLSTAGYLALSVYEQGMTGWKDPQLWERIQAEERFLITADKGFADIRHHPPGTHHGVMLLRPDIDGIRPLVELLRLVLNQYDLNDLIGTVSVVTPGGIRVRRAD
jgi:predicted nuclease of predicted toxin-antitoxin system